MAETPNEVVAKAIAELTPEKAELMRSQLIEDAEKRRQAAQEAERVRPRLYRSVLGSVKMSTGSGTPILFVNHLHITNIPEVIAYLDDQIKRGIKDVSYDPNEMYYDPVKYDPEQRGYNRARAEMEEEFARRLAEVTNPNRDMGTSVPERLSPQSTRDIAATAAGAGNSSVGKLTIPMTTVKK